MTIRTRLILAATIAVVTAVLAASALSYVAARSALLDSMDGTLRSTAHSITTNFGQIPEGTGSQVNFQYVTAAGKVLIGGSLPINNSVEEVAAGKTPSYVTDVSLHGSDFRELVEYLPVVRVTTSRRLILEYSTPAAIQVVLPLSAVDGQLGHLGIVLSGVAILGITLALLLAWLVSRMALVPLHELASSVEEVADTTDMSRRLDPGGPDELGRLRRAFNHLLSALERSDAAQRQLVLDAGHELRTPLTSLRTNLEVIRRLDELSVSDRAVLVDDVLTQLGELTDLVADLSELARGERVETAPTLTRLDQLVEDAVAIARTHGRPRDVRYDVNTEPTWVRVRRDRVARAIGNLLDNARKWSPAGGTVDVTCLGGTVTVRDRGPGIAPEDLPHVFDRFYRSAAARSLPGSGLGLSIVAQVARSENGTVTAGSAEDGGAVMRMELPIVNPEGGGKSSGAAPPVRRSWPGRDELHSAAPAPAPPAPPSNVMPTSLEGAASPGSPQGAASPTSINSMRFPNGSST